MLDPVPVMDIDYLYRPIPWQRVDDLKIGIAFIKQRDVNAIAISFPWQQNRLVWLMGITHDKVI